MLAATKTTSKPAQTAAPATTRERNGNGAQDRAGVNAEIDLSDVFAQRGLARGVAPNLSDWFSRMQRRATYLPGA